MPRIVDVQAFPVRVPLRRPLVTALGTIEHSDYSIVVVDVEGGEHGVGEISLIWHGNGGRLARDVVDLIAPVVRGLDVFDLARVMQAAGSALQFGRHTLTALAGLETALLDVQGKLTGRPVVDLLGGPARERVPLSMSLSIAPVEQMVAEAASYMDEGFRTVKVKGARDTAATAQVVEALRREFGSALGIRVDFNMAFRTYKEALAAIAPLEGFGVLSVEQPLPPEDLAGMAQLVRRCAVPIMADESVWSPSDAWRVLREGAADIVNIYVSEAGGIRAGMRIAELCAAAHVGVAVGSMPELGVGTAAAAHLAFAAPELEHPSDVCGYRYHADDVVRHDMKIVDGFLMPPTVPGLGVELDRERLARHSAEA